MKSNEKNKIIKGNIGLGLFDIVIIFIVALIRKTKRNQNKRNKITRFLFSRSSRPISSVKCASLLSACYRQKSFLRLLNKFEKQNDESMLKANIRVIELCYIELNKEEYFLTVNANLFLGLFEKISLSFQRIKYFVQNFRKLENVNCCINHQIVVTIFTSRGKLFTIFESFDWNKLSIMFCDRRL